ncbi:MAG TPA: hypothetical protein VK804_12450 [Bradyrhizobium sp.]|jgi:hypothetical protein|uniref:hypothetical protein n=1 Tax=Bradyrhizobium sp. TaxID=376 RepID=UPI002C4E8920|nr:hypothetical protein [Bradyrhizobium sp.]HTB01281.1 hypothetical protein [Bradyrhizobium sp.]
MALNLLFADGSTSPKIHKPVDGGELDFARRKSGKNAWIPPCLAASHIKFRWWLACNGQLETANGEIMCLYQAVNRRIEVVPGVGYWGFKATANLAAFASASGLVVAAIRGVCNPNHWSRP